MEFEKPINIQLFAESEGTANSSEANSQNNGNNTANNQNDTKNMVSKELFDKTASEVAELKKQLRELQKTGKSEAELRELDLKEKDDLIKGRDEEIQKRDKQLNELYIKLNQANANAKVAEIRAKINLENDTTMDTIINALVTNNGDETTKRADVLSQLLSAVYEKGRTDAKSKEWSGMSNGIASGGNNTGKDNETLSFIKNISKINTPPNTQGIKDKFK